VILSQEKQSKPVLAVSEAAYQVRCRPAPCDHDALQEKGKEQYAQGLLAAALVSYEAAWNCKQDPLYAEKSFIVACNIPNVGKAKLFWKRMNSAMKQRALMICVRNQITEEMLNAP